MSKSRRRPTGRQAGSQGSIVGLAVITGVVIAVIGGAIIGAVALLSGGDGNGDSELHAAPVQNYPYAVQMFEDEAPPAGDPSNPRHVNVGDASYNTDPPTSGAHAGQLAPAGFSDLTIPDEVLVHNMEHGYVIAWYNCNAQPILSSDDCTRLRNDLTQAIQGNPHVVAAPDTSMTDRIALTAWQFMDVMDEFDADRVATFIDTFECHYDPENTCG